MITQQILDYIKQQLATGVTRETIRATLISSGWVEEDVNNAFAAVDTSNPIPTSSVSPQSPALMPNPSRGSRKVLFGSVVGVIVLVCVAASGYYFLSQKPTSALSTGVNTVATSTPLSPPESAATPLVVQSKFGFNFTLPAGWHLWDGQSAASGFMASDPFLQLIDSIIKSNGQMNAGDVGKMQSYQSQMNNWDAASSTFVVFTNNPTIDYKDRDLARAEKYFVVPTDSNEYLNLGVITMGISNTRPDLRKTAVKTTSLEAGTIRVNGENANFAILKNHKLVDVVSISLPVDSKNAQSLLFSRYVKKGDPNAVQDLSSFISSLNIATTSSPQ